MLWRCCRLFTPYFTVNMNRVTFLLSTLMLSQTLCAQTTLESYTEQVVEYSLTLQQAALQSQSAEYELRRVKREYLPEIGFNRSAGIDFPGPREGRNWSWSTELQARQIIYDGGSITAQHRAQELEVEIEQLTSNMRLREVKLEAEEAYWTLSYATEYLSSIAYYTGIIDTLRSVILRRFEEGYSPKGDLLQIESRLSDAHYQLSSAREAYDIALYSFNSLTDNSIDTPIKLSESILSTVPSLIRCNAEQMISTHPECVIAELRAVQGRWRVRGVNSAYMPKIDIRAYGALQPSLPHTKSSGLELTAGAMLNFSSTIFHFGERHNAVQSAKASQLTLELETESIRDALRLEEQDAWTGIERTRERVVSTDKSLKIASENLEISTYAYNEGETTILDVMQAQISWLQTYKNYLRAHYDYRVALAKYRYIIGD